MNYTNPQEEILIVNHQMESGKSELRKEIDFNAVDAEN